MAGGAGGCMASLPEASPASLLLVRPCSLYFLAAAIRAAMPVRGPSVSGPSDAHSWKGRLRLGLGGRRLHVKLEGALSDLILWPRPV